MSLLNTVASGTNSLAAGGSALGLISSTQALLGLSKNQGVKGINGFVFSIPQNEQVTLSALITDHYVESNYAVQDHIAIEPLRIRLIGVVAELVYTKDQAESYINDVLDRLGPLGLLSPAGAASTRQYLAQYNRTKQAIEKSFTSAKKQFDSIMGNASKNKQQEAWEIIQGMFYSRSTVLDPKNKSFKLLSIETPWWNFENMAIENVTFSQDESTKDVSTIEISLKQIRFVEISSRTGTIKGRAASGVGVKDKGTAQGQPSGSVLFTTGAALSK